MSATTEIPVLEYISTFVAGHAHSLYSRMKGVFLNSKRTNYYNKKGGTMNFANAILLSIARMWIKKALMEKHGHKMFLDIDLGHTTMDKSSTQVISAFI